MTSKRRFLRGAKQLAALSGAMALAGCTALGLTKTTGSTSGTQVLLDIQGGLNEVQVVMAALGTAIPAAAANTINSTLAQAANAFGTLTTAVSSVTDATTVQQIVAWLEAIISALTPVLGTIPGASVYLGAVAAVAALLPGVIAFLQTILNPSTPVTPAAIAWPRGLVVPPPTVARQQLHIPGLAA